MAKWVVTGTVKIEFETWVEADSEDEAYEIAEGTWEGSGSPNVNIYGEDDPEFDSARIVAEPEPDQEPHG